MVKGFQKGNTLGGFTAAQRELKDVLYMKARTISKTTGLMMWEEFIDRAFEHAKNGESSYARLLFDHILGKPKEILSIEQVPTHLDEEKTKSLINYYLNKGFTEQEAAKRIIEVEEVNKVVYES